MFGALPFFWGKVPERLFEEILHNVTVESASASLTSCRNMEGTEGSSTLADDVANLVARLEAGRMRPVDFVAAYILRFMEHRIPQGRYLGLKNPPLVVDKHCYPNVSLGFHRSDKEARLEFGNVVEKLRVSEVNGIQITKRTNDKLKVE